MKSSATLSVLGEDESGGQPRLQSALVFVFCADRLGAPSVRFELDPRKAIELGRSREATAAANEDNSAIRVPDPRMSSRHARLLPTAGGWAVEDLGSKNGSRVGGEPVTRARLLEDGDILELGHSFFVYREDEPWAPVVGESPATTGASLATLRSSLAARFRDLQRVARSDLPVMARGETGVGKEVVARAVHGRSERQGPFIPVNCGALPDGLVEAELFGCVRGAFSGADRDRPGFVRAANGGTLFLDEVGELSLLAQAKLLRVLQERAVTPLGEAEPVPVDFRLVTATHRDLRATEDGGFRGDLLARIAGFEMAVPPLRERREDLGLLLRRFLTARGADLEQVKLTLNLGRRLMHHPWPYNIRELEKGVALALTFAEDGVMDRESLPLQDAPSPPLSKARALSPEDEARRRELLHLLDVHGGNISQVARSMGKARMQIHRWLKRYGIDPRRSRAETACPESTDSETS